MGSPHVFLLTVDCLRADRVGCYGYEKDTTPNIDKLASDGVTYTRCYSTGPRTNESFPGIVSSGLSTDCAFAGDRWHRVPPKPTIASWLSENGYDTGARLSNPQLAANKQYDHGFDSFENLAVGTVGWGVSESEENEEQDGNGNINTFFKNIGSKIHDIRSNLRESSAFSRWGFYIPLFCSYREYQRRTGWPIVDGATIRREIINITPDSTTGLNPIFRWAHFNDIHAPIHPDRVNQSKLDSIPVYRQYLSDIERIRQVESKGYERMYDSMVRYVDQQIGHVMSEIKNSGLWEDSIIIVTSDHGEALFDRGVHGHASGQDRYLHDKSRDYMYDELLNVPLIVGGGATEHNATITAPVSTAWINEIIAQLADLPKGEFVRSSGDSDLLSGQIEEVVLSDALTENGHTFSGIFGDFKLVTKSLSPEDDILENSYLFKLADDPNELRPLDHDSVPPQIEKAIRGNIRDISDLSEIDHAEQVSDQAKELLSQLGYTE
ncbi:hypothetical protein C5B90_12220 [Haloferax sp. Atlit-12N]|uniref:sulfatase n=1 Tax=Haloferax sp. Atlit-12N TaxID=2077203 RepID=UPI000E267D55|nr:sulfatase [Haloferax sp. Atlit-12N]RDZ64323.1 hypothetical protein C5B90_12220 [Haloferax sp. Atlit-12N]